MAPTYASNVICKDLDTWNFPSSRQNPDWLHFADIARFPHNEGSAAFYSLRIRRIINAIHQVDFFAHKAPLCTHFFRKDFPPSEIPSTRMRALRSCFVLSVSVLPVTLNCCTFHIQDLGHKDSVMFSMQQGMDKATIVWSPTSYLESTEFFCNYIETLISKDTLRY